MMPVLFFFFFGYSPAVVVRCGCGVWISKVGAGNPSCAGGCYLGRKGRF